MERNEFNNLLETQLGNKQWVANNQDKLIKIFPETFTFDENLDIDKMLKDFESLGINIETQNEFTLVIKVLEGQSIFIRNNENKLLIKRNPRFDINALAVLKD